MTEYAADDFGAIARRAREIRGDAEAIRTRPTSIDLLERVLIDQNPNLRPINLAAGVHLDSWGDLLQYRRGTAEDDASYRNRLIGVLQARI